MEVRSASRLPCPSGRSADRSALVAVIGVVTVAVAFAQIIDLALLVRPLAAQDGSLPPPVPRERGVEGYALRAMFQLTFPGTAGNDLLRSHDYGESLRVWGGRVDALLTPSPYFAIGARAGVRGRAWDHLENPDAHGSGGDVLAVVEARMPLGRRFDLSTSVGGGLGIGSLAVRDAGELGVSPRFDAAAALGFSIVAPVTLRLEGGYGYFRIADQLGEEALDLGGGYAALGVEMRP
jgi:hypothetical protein